MKEQIIDLDNCAREPIHIPGAIQPHGVLMVLAEPGLKVLQVSENVTEYLGLELEDLYRDGLAAFLDAEQIGRVEYAFASSDPIDHNPVHLQFSSTHDGLLLDGVVHRHEGFCFLELEPTSPPSSMYFRDFYKTVSKSTAQLQTAATLADVLQVAAGEFRQICGFDRVMIYRFSAGGEGEVIAQAKAEELHSLRGLWYPASDIPEQARRLYLINPIRVIPDVRYTPVPLVPTINPVTSRPTDLSHSGLRSVSQVHCEYLQNMGVTASMSVSIVREGKLWGLVSCHHQTPRFIPFETRNACVFLGQVLSGEITRREAEEEAAYSARAIGLQAKLLELMAATSNPLLGLVTSSPNLLDLIPGGGAAVIVGDKFQSVGITPGEEDVRGIVRSLQEARVPGTFSTRSVKNHHDASRDVRETASGVIALEISRSPESYVMFFRPEVSQTVRWGGDPNKSVVMTDDGFRIGPRKSFAVWKEEVEGMALAWSPLEIRVADELKKLVLAVTARSAS